MRFLQLDIVFFIAIEIKTIASEICIYEFRIHKRSVFMNIGRNRNIVIIISIIKSLFSVIIIINVAVIF